MYSVVEYSGTLELCYFQDILLKDGSFYRLVIRALSGHSKGYWKAGKYPVELCSLGRFSGGSSQPGLEIQDCTVQHGTKCDPPKSNLSAPSYLLLIDVKRMRLVKSDWGSPFSTVRETPEELEQHGALLLIIVSLVGQDANSGLCGVGDGSRKLAQLPVKLGPLTLVAKLPALSNLEQSSTWGGRAWTLQEGILPKSCLYLSVSQVFFAVSSMNPLEREDGNDLGRQFNIYESLVKWYSPRALTYPSDSLHAFARILSAIRDAFGWRFANAIPENMFDLALLWRPTYSIKMRPMELSGPILRRSRLDSYANKNVNLKTEVMSFAIKDNAGFRKITSGRIPYLSSKATAQPFTQASTLESESSDESAGQTALLFQASTISLHVHMISSPQLESSASSDSQIFSNSFRNALRCSLWIYDRDGHHCGTIQGTNLPWVQSRHTTHCEFVLLSRTDQDEVTQANIEVYRDNLPLEYHSSSEFYEGIFDTGRYRYKRWCALNILLVEWKGDFAERVAVRQMHSNARDMQTC
ncbi:hypothetical protein K469DRAFT_724234 [Zopfia rhizophila CBS 207.26]|uniref:Heterokaryon incompatibility domain-containing protein n=1 Tax=Zopfia rhizophila CBS 207.26 TaxID=1314779 RepID=A0A6A6EE76_9PEZI|nr:hypothetical protein K469DRAFT_724234 [Zopfia rhizophila CBS 207.26]